MPKDKKVPEPQAKPNPVLGWIAAIAVLAAVGVFLVTRPGSEAPPVAPVTAPPPVSAQPQRVPETPQQQPEPVHSQEAPPVNAAAPNAPSPQPLPSPVSAQKEPDYRVPAYFEDPAAAEPLAATLDPATVQAHARAAYEVAQKKPRLLAQLPCFCYCDRFGHKSLHDCYVSNHAEECDICMREALEADQMDSDGMSPQEIRAAIIAAHHPKS